MPAMGAIQKTTGELVDKVANACKGINMFESHANFPYIFFQKKLLDVMIKS
jgi:hypothetical protein